MSLARFWGGERRSLARAVSPAWRGACAAVLLGIVVGPGVARAAEDFHERCVKQQRNIDALTPRSHDVDRLCRCQAQRMREFGYVPDFFYSDIIKDFGRIAGAAEPNGTARLVDPKIEQAVRSRYSKAMADLAEAFRLCTARDVQREAIRGIQQGMGRGT